MKACEMTVRLTATFVLICCLAFATQSARAAGPTITSAPPNLSFGVPTGSTVSAPQAVTISVGGSGSATITNISITLPTIRSGEITTTLSTFDFTETDTCGVHPSVPSAKTISAPGSCTANVTFTPSQAAGVLESATMSITFSNEFSIPVPLTGALGAIRLLDPIDVNPSLFSPPAWPGQTVASTTVQLSCPVAPGAGQATLSSTPDGNGFVFQDNFIRVSNPSAEVSQQNVCTGGDPNVQVITGTNCFQPNYEHDFVNYAGQDPDIAQSTGQNGNADDPAGTPLLPTFGVAPLDIHSLLVQGNQTVTFELVDAGGFLGAATLHLATTCSLVNANTGTQTGNPINQQPSQTLSFDTVPGDLDQYALDYSLIPSGSITNFNSVPAVTNNPLSPTDYQNNKAAGTPFQGSACIPLASLSGNCALITQVCTPAGGNTTATGAQCPQTTAGDDFLFTSTFDPSTLIIDPNTTFAFLEFNDQGTCPLEGPEAGDPCPQNGLVSFAGPGEYGTRRGAGSTNSSTIVVKGITPPTTTVVVTPFFPTGPGAGWTNGSPSATFTGTPGPTTPTIAPIKFIEFGVNPQVDGLPPTFPIPFPGNGTFSPDSVDTNPTTCPSTYPASASPFGPTTPTSLGSFLDGSVNLLHYSTTDCANTHELQFTFNNSKWSTSFKSLTLMSDTVAPTINVTTPTSAANYTAGQKVKAAYGCTDSESGVATCAGTVPNGSNIDTTPTAGLSTPKTFIVNSKDNVGNTSPTSTVNYTVSCNYAAVTLSPSTITRPAFVTVTTSVMDCMSAPQTVKVKFTLSGPLGHNCSNSSTVMFTTPSFTIRSGTSSSFSFPFFIGRNVCAGTYTVTTTTLQGSNTIDTVTSTLIVH